MGRQVHASVCAVYLSQPPLQDVFPPPTHSCALPHSRTTAFDVPVTATRHITPHHVPRHVTDNKAQHHASREVEAMQGTGYAGYHTEMGRLSTVGGGTAGPAAASAVGSGMGAGATNTELFLENRNDTTALLVSALRLDMSGCLGLADCRHHEPAQTHEDSFSQGLTQGIACTHGTTTATPARQVCAPCWDSTVQRAGAAHRHHHSYSVESPACNSITVPALLGPSCACVPGSAPPPPRSCR